MLLAVDTSTRMMGAALYDGAQVLSEMYWRSENYHTVQLAPAVESMLAQCGVAAVNLQAVGVALGPGSFTGLRIGLAFAKGLALANNLPIVGISSMEVCAAAIPPLKMPLWALLQAGRGRFAVARFSIGTRGWQQQGDLKALTLEEFTAQIDEDACVTGELDADLRAALRRGANGHSLLLVPPAQAARRPALLAELAWGRWQANRTDDLHTLAPLYLHYGEPIAAA